MGNGRKITSDWMIKYAGRWRRVYIVQFSNAGSAYIIVDADKVFLDPDTGRRVMECRN